MRFDRLEANDLRFFGERCELREKRRMLRVLVVADADDVGPQSFDDRPGFAFVAEDGFVDGFKRGNHCEALFFFEVRRAFFFFGFGVGSDDDGETAVFGGLF